MFGFSIRLHLVCLFSTNPKTPSKGEILLALMWIFVFKSQQRVGTVPRVMIAFFMHLFHALQSGKQGPDHTHSCRYEHKS